MHYIQSYDGNTAIEFCPDNREKITPLGIELPARLIRDMSRKVYLLANGKSVSHSERSHETTFCEGQPERPRQIHLSS